MKELVKSFALVFLVLMAVLLSYLNIGVPFFISENTRSPVDIVDPLEYIRPVAINHSFGNSEYTRILDYDVEFLIWSELRKGLTRFFDSLNERTPISVKEYIDAYSKRSFMLEFDCFASDVDYIDQEYRGFFEYSEILITETAVYAKSSIDSGFYHLDSGAEHPAISDLIDQMELIDVVPYRRIMDRFSLLAILGTGDETHNYHLVPFSYNAMVTSSTSILEFDTSKSGEIIERAKPMFDERLEFVKTFYDSDGSMVVMSSSGEKSVSFSPDGILRYRGRPSKEKIGSGNFLQSLSAAIHFIKLSGQLPNDMRITQIIETDGGYNFVFDYTLYGIYPIVNNDPGSYVGISALVYSGEVVELYRQVILPERILVPKELTLYPIDRCISNNLSTFDVETNEHDAFFSIVAQIKRAGIVFRSYDGVLTPIWSIWIGEQLYYFDAVTGSFIEKRMKIDIAEAVQ